MADRRSDGSRPGQINRIVAARFREAADLLEQQGANPFRVRAYRRAAQTVAELDRDLGGILADGSPTDLESLPGVGEALSAAIEEIVRTGRWAQLERLRGEMPPEKLFQAVPGIGPALAERIADTLHIETLEALELVANDGRLEEVPGVGPGRAAMIRGSLDAMLRRQRPIRRRDASDEPSVALLLDIDREYREQAAADRLTKIAPRRFNPEHRAWLPILHTGRDGWEFTALYSNTARAHSLARVGDWVVLYYHHDSQPERQCTVVTERNGPLAGHRVVRGRELACLEHYGVEGDLTAG